MSTTKTHPEVLWAQRSSEYDEDKNNLFVTINLPDIVESSLKYELTNTALLFSAKAGTEEPTREYEFKLDFFEEVVPDQSSKRLSNRSMYLVLRKKEKKAEYWPRLTKEKIKTPYIKTDFSKWVDEDEQDEVDTKPDEDAGGMEGMGGMGGMPGMGGMGGMPGMGGMGGMGGMPGMGGMGGMPGMEGMDFEKMMAQMGGMGGAGGMADLGEGGSGEANDSDSDDDGPPPLEAAEPAKS